MCSKNRERWFRSVIYLTLSLFCWGFSFFVSKAISPGELLISKLQITGGTGKTDNDYVSIYNNSDHVLDLQGLRLVKRTASGTADTTIKSWVEPTFLNPGVYYTWANSNNGFATVMQANTSSTQTIANDNGLALRLGTENNGQILDSVAWGDATNILIETNPYATNPGANQTLERINNQDSNNNALDFQIIPTVFPSSCGNSTLENEEECDDGNIVDDDGCSAMCRLDTVNFSCGNNIIENGETCDDGNTTNGDGCSASCELEITNNANIYINEFVADPVAGAHEWIELYTPSIIPIIMTNWSIEDGGGTKTKIAGSIGGNNKFLVIEKPSGALNNNGDTIILRNAQGDIINQVTYGDWDDGNVNDNAPSTPDPYSVARKQDGITTTIDSFDWAITTTTTKGFSNTITSPPVEEEETELSKEITISEIYPNPPGIDILNQTGEFIELYNQGNLPATLSGWRLEIGAKEYVYEIPENTLIAGNDYFLIPNSYYKLPNSGSSVKLFQPGKTTAYQTVTYKEATEGQSWMLINENKISSNKMWQWTRKPTPQKLNILINSPRAYFDVIGDLTMNTSLLFDSSDSQTDKIVSEFKWDFGDNTSSKEIYPQHTFKKIGTYTVTLTVKNEYGASTLAKKIKIVAPTELTKLTIATTNEHNEMSFDLTPQELESIKINEILPNPSGKDEGHEWIELINQGDTAIALNGWRIATHNKKGSIIQDSIIEPSSLLLLPAAYVPILGNTNETIQLLAPDSHVVDSINYDKAPENQSYALINGSWSWTSKLTPGQDNIITISNDIEKINTKKQSNESYLTGIVVSLPGTFSAQYFHLKPNNSEGLIQIYNSKKLFPPLKLYEKITVHGEMSSVAAGPRLKIKEATDINLLGQAESPEFPLVNSTFLTQPPYPRLIKIEGEVTSKKSPRLIVTDANGDSEVYLAKGSNVSITRFTTGDQITVTGILELSGTTPRLMPRSEADIIFLNASETLTSTTDIEKVNTTLTNNSRNQKKELFTYLILVAILLLGTGGYGLWKWYGKNRN